MKRLVLAAALLLPSLAQAASVLTTPLPAHLFAFTTSGGLINPEVIVGFNPQPDPPGFPYLGTLDLGNPEAPSLLLPAVRGSYSVLIGLLIPGNPVTVGLPPSPNSDGNTGFEATFGDGSVFKVNLHIDGFLGDWASLNPQPLPPGGFQALGTSFFGFTGDPMATISIFELIPNGDPLPLSFSLVPEPATMALLPLPILALAGSRRRARS